MITWSDPGFSAVLAGGYLGLMSLTWSGLALGVGRWGTGHRLDAQEPTPAELPLLSICIPARNEEGKIGAAVRSALTQDHPNFEVLVVDDRSEDNTRQEALDAGGGDPRLRVVAGVEPPAGWAGKPWACQRAAGEAAGEQLLFVDADLRLAPWAARTAASRMQARGLALLSLFGDWALESFWEVAVIPVIGWFIRGSVDLDAINDPGRREAFANGQFILVERGAYDSLGGHEAVRAEVLEDVRLAQAFKQRGLPTGLFHAPEAFSVRLYTRLSEIVSGYGKNLYEGMGRRPGVALGAMTFIAVSTLLPYALLGAWLGSLLGIWPGPTWPWGAWLLGVIALIHTFRFRLERADGRSGLHALTHPLGNLMFAWILLRSLFGVESEWKGRRFVDGKAEGA
ncbi:MAG: glycosyltransferase [Myxococcota bacterium]|nr:glycosyltransferase [Myxococcota bacterium]